MLDVERDATRRDVIEYKGYTIEIEKDHLGYWRFLKGSRKELSDILKGVYTDTHQARPAFIRYVRGLADFREGGKPVKDPNKPKQRRINGKLAPKRGH